MAPRRPAAGDESACLHAGGRAAAWGNLGLWRSTADDYAGACEALARAVGEAAALRPGDRVLGLACGAGEELALWRVAFGAGALAGIEADERLARAAAARVPDAELRVGPAQDLLADMAQRFDAVLCVDAVYHLGPRLPLFERVAGVLEVGGRFAFTDLVLDREPSPPLAAMARLAGVPIDELADLPTRVAQLRAAGFAEVVATRLDEAVLGGFARFAAAQAARFGWRAWHPGWRRVALTARLIGPCRRAGLGYALLAATWPGRPAAGPPHT
ncbi:MAG: methyltransferase domain-containing protein [Rubrivivax sp.]|nr:methyltransferase domain-containing protein [Rubrivivax sp.]